MAQILVSFETLERLTEYGEDEISFFIFIITLKRVLLLLLLFIVLTLLITDRRLSPPFLSNASSAIKTAIIFGAMAVLKIN